MLRDEEDHGGGHGQVGRIRRAQYVLPTPNLKAKAAAASAATALAEEDTPAGVEFPPAAPALAPVRRFR